MPPERVSDASRCSCFCNISSQRDSGARTGGAAACRNSLDRFCVQVCQQQLRALSCKREGRGLADACKARTATRCDSTRKREGQKGRVGGRSGRELWLMLSVASLTCAHRERGREQ